MRYTIRDVARTAPPLPQLCPSGAQARMLRLEIVIPEEIAILKLERKIADARREGKPVGALIEERQKWYESWLQRIDGELSEPLTEAKRDELTKQRERAVREYKWGTA